MTRGYAAIACHNAKTPANMGAVLRAAQCYRASLVVFGGDRARDRKGIVNACTDTGKAWRHIPTIWSGNVMDSIPRGSVPIAVELTDAAVPLTTFEHPHRAFYIFGPEDGTLGRAITDHVAATIQVPTAICMNLAATVNVVLYDRLAKAARTHTEEAA